MVENNSLFVMKAAMNFVQERQNGGKCYSHDFEYQKLYVGLEQMFDDLH